MAKDKMEQRKRNLKLFSLLQRTAKDITSEARCVLYKQFSSEATSCTYKHGAEIHSADRKLPISKRVSDCPNIEFAFSACDNEAKSIFMLGIKL